MAKETEFKAGDRVKVIINKNSEWLQEDNRIGTIITIDIRHFKPRCFLKMDKRVKNDTWNNDETLSRESIPKGYAFYGYLDELEKIDKSKKTQPPTPAELFRQGKLKRFDYLVATEDVGYSEDWICGRFAKDQLYKIIGIKRNCILIQSNSLSWPAQCSFDESKPNAWGHKFRFPTKNELRKAGKVKTGEKIEQVTLDDYREKVEAEPASRKPKPRKKELTPQDLKTIDAVDKMVDLFKKARKTNGNYPIFGFESENRELVGPRVVDKTTNIKKTLRSLAKVFYYLVSGESAYTNISFLLDDWPRLKDDNVWYIVSMLYGWEKDGERYGYKNKAEAIKDLKGLKEKIKSKAIIEKQPAKKKEKTKKKRTMKTKGVIVHCSTKEDWKKVIKAAIEDGCIWGGSRDRKIHKDYWHDKETNVKIYDNRELFRDNKVYQFPIISAQEYLRRIKEKYRPPEKNSKN